MAPVTRPGEQSTMEDQKAKVTLYWWVERILGEIFLFVSVLVAHGCGGIFCIFFLIVLVSFPCASLYPGGCGWGSAHHDIGHGLGTGDKVFESILRNPSSA